MKTQPMALIIFTLSVLVLTSCSSQPVQPTLDATQSVQLLAGEYTTVITAADVEAFTFSSDPDLAANQGTWRMIMLEDGTFTAELNGAFIAHGNYNPKGNRMEVYIDQVCEDCDCLKSIDRYTWNLEGDSLAFSHQAGTCNGLRLVLTAHPLARIR